MSLESPHKYILLQRYFYSFYKYQELCQPGAKVKGVVLRSLEDAMNNDREEYMQIYGEDILYDISPVEAVNLFQMFESKLDYAQDKGDKILVKLMHEGMQFMRERFQDITRKPMFRDSNEKDELPEM